MRRRALDKALPMECKIKLFLIFIFMLCWCEYSAAKGSSKNGTHHNLNITVGNTSNSRICKMCRLNITTKSTTGWTSGVTNQGFYLYRAPVNCNMCRVNPENGPDWIPLPIPDEENHEIHGIRRNKIPEMDPIWDDRPRMPNQVKTTCTNPTVNRIDECIENMDDKVVEKCMPGLQHMLNHIEETSHGPFVVQTNQSEVCLRQVFGHCSYDSRYRITTKIKKNIGINMNINFQEEFEMDCCDEQSLHQVLENIKDCFNNGEENFKNNIIDSNKQNISTDIIDLTGQCIDDHTAFDCALDNKTLFRNTMRQIIDLLKVQSLNILEILGPETHQYTRLCLKWIDHTRIETCENEFFDYVLCLRNGTYDAILFGKVQQCFYSSLKVCPADTVKAIIRILAGAVEGHSGKEPEIWIPGQPGGVDRHTIYRPGDVGQPGGGHGQIIYRPGDVGQPGGGHGQIIYRPGDVGQPGGGHGHIIYRPGDVGQPGDGHGQIIYRPGAVGQPGDVHEEIIYRPGNVGQPGDVHEEIIYRPGDVGQPDVGHEDIIYRPGDVGQPGVGHEDIIYRPGDVGQPGDGHEEIIYSPGDDGVIHTEENHCTDEILTIWIQNIKTCVLTKAKRSQDLESRFIELYYCVRQTKPTECEFHKFSQFKYIIDKINAVIRIFVTFPKTDNSDICINEIVSPKPKDCIVKLFLYFVAIHHASHSKASLQEQLVKVKLCFEVNLRNCPFTVIQILIRIYAAVFRIPIPTLNPAQIITKVTIPEGYLWCETRIVSDQIPPEVTEEIHETPPEYEFTEEWKPTATERTDIYQTPRRHTDIIYTPRIPTFYYTRPARVYSEYETPTTSLPITVFIREKERDFSFPFPGTEITKYFPSPGVVEERRTRSTVENRIITWPDRYYTEEETVPRIITYVYPFPEKPYVYEEITPSTIGEIIETPPDRYYTYEEAVPKIKKVVYPYREKPHREFITPTTIEREIYYPSKIFHSHTRSPARTIIDRIPVEDKFIIEVIQPTTTELDTFVVTDRPGHVIRKRPRIRTMIYGPTEAEWIEWETPSTVITDVWRITKDYIVDYQTETTIDRVIDEVKLIIKDKDVEVVSDYEIYKPEVRDYYDVMTQTTMDYWTVTYPGWDVVEETAHGPRTIICEFTLEGWETYEYMTPTTVVDVVHELQTEEFMFTAPEVFIRTKIYEWKAKSYVEYETETEVQTEIYRPTEEIFYEDNVETTMFVKVIESKHKVFSEIVPYATEVYIFTPKDYIWSEVQHQTTTESIGIFVRPPITYEDRRQTVTPDVFVYRPTMEVIEMRTPSTICYYTIVIPGGWWRKTRRPPLIWTRAIYPTSHYTEFHMSPTTFYTEREIIEEERYTMEERETTLNYRILQPRIIYKHLTERPRTTAIYSFEYGDTDYDIWTPSSVYTEIFRVPVTGFIKERPLPETEYFYYTEGGSDYEVFTRSTYEEEYYTLGEREIEYVYEKPKIRVFSIGPKPRPIIFDHLTPTEIYYNTIPIEHETYTDIVTETLINIQVIEQKPEYDYVFGHEATTCIIEHRPITDVFYETLAPFTYERRVYTVPSIYVPKMRKPQPTEFEIFTLTDVDYTDSIERTTVIPQIWSVPGWTQIYTRPRHHIKLIIITPQTDIYEEWETPTTIDTIRFSVPDYSVEERRPDSTVQLIIEEIPEIEFRTEMPYTIPDVTVFRLKPRTYFEYQTQSTVDTIMFTFTTDVIFDTRRPARTITDIYIFPEWEKQEWITPTPVEYFSFMPSIGYDRRTRRTVTPKIIIKWPTKRPYTEYYTQSTTDVIWYTFPEDVYVDYQESPTTRTIIRFPRPTEETYYESQPTTQRIEYSPGPREYSCIYPTSGSVIKTCKEHKRNCNEFELWRWKNKIRICVFDRLREMGRTIDEFIVKGPQFKELEDIVIECIKIIGDTPCRNKTFNLLEWILEKDLAVVGRYGDRAKNRNPADDFPFNVKKCVTLILEDQMNKCFPGLYQVLADIVLYRKPTVTLELLKPQPHRCLLLSLRHCNLRAKQALEKILQSTFHTCIKLTGSSEQSVCEPVKPMVEADGTEYDLKECESPVVVTFLQTMRQCINPIGHGVGSSVIKVTPETFTKNFYKCAQYKLPHSCIITVWKTAEPVYEYLTEGLKGMKVDKCTEQLLSENFKCCLQDIFSLAPYLEEFDDIESSILPALQCIKYEARFCSSNTIHYIIQSLKIILGLDTTDDKTGSNKVAEYGDYGITISSIIVSDDSIDVCEHIFRARPDEHMSRPIFEDECVPISSNQVGGQSNSYLIRACTEEKVHNWIQGVRSCLDDKVTQIGLKNPEFLTLNRVLSSLKICIYEQGIVGCSPKYLPDFKHLYKSVLDMVKQNSLSSRQKECRDKLRIENQSRCISTLHKYLVWRNEPQMEETNRNKAFQCIDSSIPECCEVAEEELNILSLALVPDAMNLQKMGDNELQECDPYGKSVAEPDTDIDYIGNPVECPGGIRVLNKRDVNNLEYGKSSYRKGKLSNTENIDVSETVKEYQEWNSECSHQDYVHYFQKLTKCRDWKLTYQFSGQKARCYLSDMKVSWVAMIECLVEEDDIVLSCNVTSRQQLDTFLNHATEALNSNQPNNDTACLKSGWCYGKRPPILNRCIDSFQQLLHMQNTSSDIVWKMFNITKDVVNCLSSIWPSCPLTVPIMSLPFIYIPFGLHSVVTKDLNFTMCNKSSFENFTREPQCVHNYGKNKTDSHQVVKDIEECKVCIKPKKAICFFNNITDTLEATDQDFMYMYQCLTNYRVTDECIQGVISRAKNNCLPLFYQCSASVQDGNISKMLGSCWEFHKCLKHIHKSCPDEFQTFIPDVYYDILGLNSAFQKLNIAL